MRTSAANCYSTGRRFKKDLIADYLQVDQSMSCGDGFSVVGDVRLPGAHLGRLQFGRGEIQKGLIAEQLQVDRDMRCDRGLTVIGKTVLTNAHVGGQLSLSQAVLTQGLNGEGLRVDQDMLCDTGFAAAGEVRLLDAQVARLLSFDGATLPHSDRTLDFTRARIGGELRLLFANRPPGGVDLTNARMGRITDSEKTWPARLHLRGCVYDGLEAYEDARDEPTTKRRSDEFERDDVRKPPPRRGAAVKTWPMTGLRWRVRSRRATDVQQRLRWIYLAEEGHLPEKSRSRRVMQQIALARHLVVRTDRRLLQRDPPQRAPAAAANAGFAPQPYTQLMAVYRREGRDRDARRVAYERERRRRSDLRLPGKAWNLFLQGTVGFGYKPLRALLLLATLLVAGTLVFSSFHGDGHLRAVKTAHPPFVASIYTLDRLIPVVSFGLRDAFAPSGGAQWWAFAYTLLGWILTIAVVAGVTAAVRRD